MDHRARAQLRLVLQMAHLLKLIRAAEMLSWSLGHSQQARWQPRKKDVLASNQALVQGHSHLHLLRLLPRSPELILACLHNQQLSALRYSVGS